MRYAALLERMRPAAEVYKSFQRVSEQIAREPRPAPPAGGRKPLKFTVSEAAEVIRSALAPLGNEDYAKELAALLDPASGRVDLVGGPNRAGGGGANGYPGLPSVIYLETFGESYNDLSRLGGGTGLGLDCQY